MIWYLQVLKFLCYTRYAATVYDIPILLPGSLFNQHAFIRLCIQAPQHNSLSYIH